MSSIIKAGVIGHPISHSLSPKLHNYWLKKYKIDGEYKAYEISSDALFDFVSRLREKGFAGCNVTIPHKEMAVSLVRNLDESASVVGAVNTIVVERDGTLTGMNTDAYGFAQNIISHIKSKNKVVVLGAGGAARAVLYALKVSGFNEIIIINRTQARAEIILKGLGKNISVEPWENRSAILSGCDLLVNTTSLGMVGQPPLDISLEKLPKTALVTDIVYKPLITPLLQAAKDRDNPIVDGLGMLLHQAVPGFEAWFGIRPEVTQELRDYILGS